MTGAIPHDDDDMKSLALCAWKEARGEGVYGMQAVMWVCVNRSQAPGFPKSLHDVIYGKNQFTSMSRPDDPQFNLAPPENDTSWLGALVVANQVLQGVLQDVTRGAQYYANLAAIDKGGWFDRHILGDPARHPVTATIGHHTFFG